jgi:hypothetical protein
MLTDMFQLKEQQKNNKRVLNYFHKTVEVQSQA